MKGWQIVKHSLRQVFGNLEGALRVSLALYLVQFAIGLALGAGAMSMGAGGQMSMGFGIGALVALVVAAVTSLWIAVAWHRYVLLGEEVATVPAFRGDRILAYFLRSLGYGVILIVIGVIWGLIVGFALGGMMMNSPVMAMVLMAFLVYLPLLVIGFRIMADLPSTALGTPQPFFSGWRATSGQTMDIAIMAVIVVVVAVAVELVVGFVISGIPILVVIWQFVIGWLQTMIGVSILTTLYGHYIEKRELV